MIVGGCFVHCNITILAAFLALHTWWQKDSDNQKCLQTLPNIPRGERAKSPSRGWESLPWHLLLSLVSLNLHVTKHYVEFYILFIWIIMQYYYYMYFFKIYFMMVANYALYKHIFDIHKCHIDHLRNNMPCWRLNANLSYFLTLFPLTSIYII